MSGFTPPRARYSPGRYNHVLKASVPSPSASPETPLASVKSRIIALNSVDMLSSQDESPIRTASPLFKSQDESPIRTGRITYQRPPIRALYSSAAAQSSRPSLPREAEMLKVSARELPVTTFSSRRASTIPSPLDDKLNWTRRSPSRSPSPSESPSPSRAHVAVAGRLEWAARLGNSIDKTGVIATGAAAASQSDSESVFDTFNDMTVTQKRKGASSPLGSFGGRALVGEGDHGQTGMLLRLTGNRVVTVAGIVPGGAADRWILFHIYVHTRVRTRTHTYTRASTHALTHTRTHTHTYTHIDSLTHTHTHTHTHVHARARL